MISVVESSLKEAHDCLSRLLENKTAIQRVSQAGELIGRTFSAGGKLISCGNGGSMCDAMHLAEELTGRYRDNRRALPAVAIGDGGHLTCCGNDFGFDSVFARFVEGHGRKGDVLVGISTSGGSANVVRAMEKARELGMKTVALTGRASSKVGSLADVDICTPGLAYADRVQELHIKVIHILIEVVERQLFPELYP